MTDALKRISKTKDQAFQDRCSYYMYQKAAAVFAETTPDADDLLLAKALWANKVSMQDMARIVVTNAPIGAAIDAGNTPAEGDIEYVIVTAGSFHQLALAYKSAGLIGG
jgi:hypothetical protein